MAIVSAKVCSKSTVATTAWSPATPALFERETVDPTTRQTRAATGTRTLINLRDIRHSLRHTPLPSSSVATNWPKVQWACALRGFFNKASKSAGLPQCKNQQDVARVRQTLHEMDCNYPLKT